MSRSSSKAATMESEDNDDDDSDDGETRISIASLCRVEHLLSRFFHATLWLDNRQDLSECVLSFFQESWSFC